MIPKTLSLSLSLLASLSLSRSLSLSLSLSLSHAVHHRSLISNWNKALGVQYKITIQQYNNKELCGKILLTILKPQQARTPRRQHPNSCPGPEKLPDTGIDSCSTCSFWYFDKDRYLRARSGVLVVREFYSHQTRIQQERQLNRTLHP